MNGGRAAYLTGGCGDFNKVALRRHVYGNGVVVGRLTGYDKTRREQEK